MCGRFSLYSVDDLVKWLHGLRPLPPLRPRYNIAPTDVIAVARNVPDAPAGQRELVPMRWGYVPHWADEPKAVPLMFNARSEEVREKPAFRGALRHKRCLVPADGFFEWETTKSGKRPLYYHMKDRSLFGMAAIWTSWHGPGDHVIDSCAILTCGPNALVEPIHDRMPVILPKEHYDAWLDPMQQDDHEMQRLLQPFPAEKMDAYTVTPRMNTADFDEPAAVAPGGQQSLF